jgi:hypothetical protein
MFWPFTAAMFPPADALEQAASETQNAAVPRAPAARRIRDIDSLSEGAT